MWIFNPPLAPQKAIQMVLGNLDVNDEEMMTTFIGVEALLNSLKTLQYLHRTTSFMDKWEVNPDRK